MEQTPKLTVADVEYVANLARLSLTDEEKQSLTEELARILAYIEKLNQLDTAEIPPTSHVLSLSNVLREDKVAPSLRREVALENAPQAEAELFKVPKIIE